MFKDRADAGKQLAEALKDEFKDAKDTIVLALPRGGVALGYEISKALNLPLDIIVPRKIGAEFNPEYAIGAITETGEAVWNETERKAAKPEYIKKIVAEEKAEAARRLKTYRGDRPSRNIENKTVILVDDGVATGLTMRAAIKTARAEKPKKIAVAVPHGAQDSLKKLREEVDELMVLDEPMFYGAVGAFYENFPQNTDEEVIKLLKEVKKP
ncbi:phosphoribosyltransferase [Patescibacteria group bacterium]|nr:phosphoribosyltransferase [Patescibacteria group bacterium]